MTKLILRTVLSGILAGLMIASPIALTGCNEDQIIAGIQTAADVATQAANILTPVNAEAGLILSAVAKGLSDLDKAYLAYDAASASNKAGAIGVVEALVSTLQSQLSSILADVRVKNPPLVATITIAVAVVNSAVLALYNKVASRSAPLVTARVAIAATGPGLPTIPNAKSSKDLAKAWNSQVGKDFQVKAH